MNEIKYIKYLKLKLSFIIIRKIIIKHKKLGRGMDIFPILNVVILSHVHTHVKNYQMTYLIVC